MIPLGFEPKTHSLEGCCSIQLSYGTDARIVVAARCRCKSTKFRGFCKLNRPIFRFSGRGFGLRTFRLRIPPGPAAENPVRATAFRGGYRST